MSNGDNGRYPVALDGNGCKYGQRLDEQLEAERAARKEQLAAERLARKEEIGVERLARKEEWGRLTTQMDKLGAKVDKLAWALVGAALTFAGAAVGLVLNLVR